MEFYLKDEYIKLGQLLKASGMVENGVEAKERIINGDVLVNNEVDLRRGRKIVKNDIVEIDGEKIKVL